MKSPNSANLPGLEDKSFILLIIAVSLAFAWILWPYSGAVLWSAVLAIVFALDLGRKRSIRDRHRLAVDRKRCFAPAAYGLKPPSDLFQRDSIGRAAGETANQLRIRHIAYDLS